MMINMRFAMLIMTYTIIYTLQIKQFQSKLFMKKCIWIKINLSVILNLNLPNVEFFSNVYKVVKKIPEVRLLLMER